MHRAIPETMVFPCSGGLPLFYGPANFLHHGENSSGLWWARYFPFVSLTQRPKFNLNPQPQRGVTGEYFEAKCGRNTSQWTAEQGKEAE